MDLPVHWVATQQQLDALSAILPNIECAAFDTEFIKRDTYYPILALVQVNTGEGIYLIDAPSLDLSDFWQALAAMRTSIWYACGEDLGIFYWLSGCPVLENVVDVQIAMAYLTGELQIGYARAVEMRLGICLDKSESQSDWLARPLSDEQHTYACQDVQYLLELYASIKEALVQQHWQYVLEDSRHYARTLYDDWHKKDDELYLSAIAPTYRPEQIAVLKALMAWREQEARQSNRPAPFVISRQALKEMVLALPTNYRALSQTTWHRRELKRHADTVLALIDQAKHDKQTHHLVSAYTLDKSLKSEFAEQVQMCADTLGIASNVFYKNRWLEALIQAALGEPISEPYLLGYRKEAIHKLVAFLSLHKDRLAAAQ